MSKAFVKDSLAELGKTRVHEIITRMGADGRTPIETRKYSLNSETGLEMPLDHAMQFLKDPAFIVTGENGERIMPVPVQKDGGVGSLVIKPDECIAQLSELTTEALYKRCKILPAADTITAASTREDLIGFLYTKAQVKEVVTKTDVAANTAAKGLDTMSGPELERLFTD